MRVSKGRWSGRRRIFLGTSLVEVALTIVIVGVGIAAMMQFLTAATSANRALSDYPVAVSIARAGHEWARAQQISDVQAKFLVDAATPGGYLPFTSPLPQALAGTADLQRTYAAWSQRFSMRRVLVQNPNATDETRASDALEITVSAIKGGAAVCSLKRVYYVN